MVSRHYCLLCCVTLLASASSSCSSRTATANGDCETPGACDVPGEGACRLDGHCPAGQQCSARGACEPVDGAECTWSATSPWKGEVLYELRGEFLYTTAMAPGRDGSLYFCLSSWITDEQGWARRQLRVGRLTANGPEVVEVFPEGHRYGAATCVAATVDPIEGKAHYLVVHDDAVWMHSLDEGQVATSSNLTTVVFAEEKDFPGTGNLRGNVRGQFSYSADGTPYLLLSTDLIWLIRYDRAAGTWYLEWPTHWDSDQYLSGSSAYLMLDLADDPSKPAFSVYEGEPGIYRLLGWPQNDLSPSPFVLERAPSLGTPILGWTTPQGNAGLLTALRDGPAYPALLFYLERSDVDVWNYEVLLDGVHTTYSIGDPANVAVVYPYGSSEPVFIVQSSYGEKETTEKSSFKFLTASVQVVSREADSWSSSVIVEGNATGFQRVIATTVGCGRPAAYFVEHAPYPEVERVIRFHYRESTY